MAGRARDLPLAGQVRIEEQHLAQRHDVGLLHVPRQFRTAGIRGHPGQRRRVHRRHRGPFRPCDARIYGGGGPLA
ncbi:hypothetical protein G6F31_021735 [Rhizopus arrhizus]|nr:hypothetical protein G6F31_021735 [Rhizopus arrhizus]